MPNTCVYFYCDDGDVPVRDWLQELKRTNRKAFVKCVVRIRRLEECGTALRRPEADLLRDGIYELRIGLGHVNYRILYFFHGQQIALLAHALTKEDVVPVADIERALRRKRAYEVDPERHVYETDLGEI